jgi:hypothetical protein
MAIVAIFTLLLLLLMCYVDSTSVPSLWLRRIIGGVEERSKRQTLQDVEIDKVEGTGKPKKYKCSVRGRLKGKIEVK